MIEIREPAIEALIQERLVAGAFASVEEVLLQALEDAPLRNTANSGAPAGPTGLEIIAAFERSPHKEIDIFPRGHVLRISDPVEF